jgi:hypothetical protein
MAESLHPAAPHHLPSFITAPGDTDVLMVLTTECSGFGSKEHRPQSSGS